jgi:hypothetical protein
LIKNRCGCDWAANEQSPELVADAQAAWDTLVAAGCEPDCPSTCALPPSWACVPLPIGTDGTCEASD